MYLLRVPLKELGDRPASSLRVPDWTALRAKYEEKYSGSTLNQILAWLKTLLRWSVDQGTLAAEPHICRAKPQKCKVARETAPTEADVGALLDLAGARERVIILCACDAGMRRNEIRQLQRSWINRARSEIVLPNWACKGGRGRTVSATRRLLEAIDNVPMDIRSPYVLVNPMTGQLYCTVTLTKWWRELAREAKLQAAPGEGSVHLHDGRGAFATHSVERGVKIETVSAELGHASLDTTMVYIRRRRQRRSADLAQARELFEAGIERDTTRR